MLPPTRPLFSLLPSPRLNPFPLFSLFPPHLPAPPPPFPCTQERSKRRRLELELEGARAAREKAREKERERERGGPGAGGGGGGGGGPLSEELRIYKNMVKCAVCHDRPKDTLITKCCHVFCQHCVRKNLDSRHRKCPRRAPRRERVVAGRMERAADPSSCRSCAARLKLPLSPSRSSPPSLTLVPPRFFPACTPGPPLS